MSSQVTFFIFADESSQFIRNWIALGAKPIEEESDATRATILPFTELDKARQLATIHRIYLLSPCKSENDVRMRKFKKDGATKWYVDVIASPVVELDLSTFESNRLSSGRMYFVSKYYDGPTATQKPESVRTWASSLFKNLRRALVKIPNENAYASADAYKEAAAHRIILSLDGRPVNLPRATD